MARIFIAMNGKRINTLDELRENFNAAQMISFYRGGRLQKWLEEIGATEELENIQSFEEGYDDDTLLSMLMAVFELSDEQIAKATPTQPEPVAEEVPAENAATADEKHTGETDKQSFAIEEESSFCTTNTGWQLCQLETKDTKGKLLANTQDIAECDLASSKLISGRKQSYAISSAFFFDGKFWAKVFTGEGYDVIWAKSEDGIHWEFDTELNKLLSEDSYFNVKRIKVSDKHVFMLQYSGYSKSLVMYSPQNGWSEKELNMDSIMSSPEYESNLEDVYEQNDYVGIVGIRRWETGFFEKEYHWSHEIYSCSDLSDCRNTDFSNFIFYDNYSYGDVIANAFKDYLFVASWEDTRSKFLYAELDQENPKFKNVELPEEINIGNDDKFFVFDNAMFVISTEFHRNAGGKLLFTADGLEWKACEINSEKITDVAFTGKYYVAITEDEQGKSTLYSSETGEIWNKVQTFTFSRGENVNVLTAGNDKVLIYNGSSSGKYILVNATMI